MGGERTEASREREREGGLPSFLPSSSSSFLPCPPSLFFSSGWAFPLTPKSPFSPPPTLTHTQPLSLLRRRRSNIVRPSPLPSMPPFSTCLSRLLLLRRPTEPHPLFPQSPPAPRHSTSETNERQSSRAPKCSHLSEREKSVCRSGRGKKKARCGEDTRSQREKKQVYEISEWWKQVQGKRRRVRFGGARIGRGKRGGKGKKVISVLWEKLWVTREKKGEGSKSGQETTLQPSFFPNSVSFFRPISRRAFLPSLV